MEKVRQKLVKQWVPTVTLSEIQNFKANVPETYTRSDLLNAVLEAMSHREVLSKGGVSEYLGVDKLKLSKAMELICGMNINEIRAELIMHKWRRLINENPMISRRELAAALGFKTPSMLLRFRDRWNKRFPERPIMVRATRNFSDKSKGGWK